MVYGWDSAYFIELKKMKKVLTATGERHSFPFLPDSGVDIKNAFERKLKKVLTGQVERHSFPFLPDSRVDTKSTTWKSFKKVLTGRIEISRLPLCLTGRQFFFKKKRQNGLWQLNSELSKKDHETYSPFNTSEWNSDHILQVYQLESLILAQIERWRRA